MLSWVDSEACISRNMLLKRIKKWKLNRHVKAAVKMAIVRKEAERCSVHKRSAFRLHGTDVPSHIIERFRQTLGPLSDIESSRLTAGTPPGLECYTPLASPLSTPRVIEIPERTAKLCRDYIRGSFDPRTWSQGVVSAGVVDCFNLRQRALPDRMNDFLNWSAMARRHWSSGYKSIACQSLDATMLLVKDVLVQETPGMLSRMILSSYEWIFDAANIALDLEFSDPSAT